MESISDSSPLTDGEEISREPEKYKLRMVDEKMQAASEMLAAYLGETLPEDPDLGSRFRRFIGLQERAQERSGWHLIRVDSVLMSAEGAVETWISFEPTERFSKMMPAFGVRALERDSGLV
jgi:hypothetical protein